LGEPKLKRLSASARFVLMLPDFAALDPGGASTGSRHYAGHRFAQIVTGNKLWKSAQHCCRSALPDSLFHKYAASLLILAEMVREQARFCQTSRRSFAGRRKGYR
jgi:hypothetical protein